MADHSSSNSETNETHDSEGVLMALFKEVFSSPLNVGLLCVCVFLVYKIFSGRSSHTVHRSPGPALPPPMKKRDFTLEQLREYDGTGKDGRVLIAVNSHVYDVTAGKHFYGKGGPYAAFAGRDASRGLATFSVGEDAVRDEYDDLSDLDSTAMESMREWEMQFKEKYHFVGRLLKPGEDPSDYTDTEEAEESSSNVQEKSKDN